MEIFTSALVIWRNVLRGHQNHQWLAKVTRDVLENKRIVGVDDYEQRASCEWIQVAWVEAVRLLVCR